MNILWWMEIPQRQVLFSPGWSAYQLQNIPYGESWHNPTAATSRLLQSEENFLYMP